MANLFDNPRHLDQLAAGKQQDAIDDGETIYDDEPDWRTSPEVRKAEYNLFWGDE